MQIRAINRSSGARIAHPKSAHRNESQGLAPLLPGFQAPDFAVLWTLWGAFCYYHKSIDCSFPVIFFAHSQVCPDLYLEVLFPSCFTLQIPMFRCLGICHSSGPLWSPTSSSSMLEPSGGRQEVCKKEHQTWRIELCSPRRYPWAVQSGTGYTAWAPPVDLTNFLSRFLQVLNVLVTYWKDL